MNKQEKRDIVKGVLEMELEDDTGDTRDAILKQARDTPLTPDPST